MKKGTVGFSSRSYDFSLMKAEPELQFSDGDTVIDRRCLSSANGYYCRSCGCFTVSFDVKKNTGFEEGFDMDFSEYIDCLPKKTCPRCGENIDIDYPKCPECGHNFEE